MEYDRRSATSSTWPMLRHVLLIAVGAASVCCGGPAFARAPTGTDVTVALVALGEPSASDRANQLPVSQMQFDTGSTVFVEVWAQTLAPNGFAQVSLDITFEANALSVPSPVIHTALFPLFTSGSNASAGLIDNVSGSVNPVIPACSGAVGAAPDFARLAVVPLRVNVPGQHTIVAGPADSVVFVIANCGSLVPPAVAFQNATITAGSTGPPIPAVSAWGCGAMIALLLSAGGVVLRKRAFSSSIL